MDNREEPMSLQEYMRQKASKSSEQASSTPKPEQPNTPTNTPGIQGQLPLPSRQVGTFNSESPMDLSGWKAADQSQIPKEAFESVDPSIFDPKLPDPDTPPLQVAEEVSIDQLPTEHQLELAKFADQALQSDDINAASLAENTRPINVQVGELDRPPTGFKPQLQPGGPSNLQPAEKDSTPETSKPEQEPKSEPKQKSSDAGAVPKTDVCPHCNQNVSRKPGKPPSEQDEERFVAAILAGKPFCKQYTLYGKLKLEFRTLMAQEVDEIYQQLKIDSEAQNLSVVEFGEKYNRYRIALSLVSYNGESLPQSLEQWRTKIDRASIEVVSYEVTGSVIKSELATKAVASAYSDFLRIVSVIEAKMKSPDF